VVLETTRTEEITTAFYKASKILPYPITHGHQKSPLESNTGGRKVDYKPLEDDEWIDNISELEDFLGNNFWDDQYQEEE